MARTPASNDAFFREVNDEVRREQMARAVRRYGILAAVVVMVALLAFGGWLLWQNHRAKMAGENGERLTAAMSALSSGNVADARKGLTAITADDAKGYAPLARMLTADMAIQRRADPDAAAGFMKVANDVATPQPLRDLALVRATALSFDTLAPAQVIARLKPLAAPGGAWFGSAGEMTAIAQLRLGQRKAAATTFAAIARDRGVPPTVRERAAQLAGDLGIDVSAGAVQPGDSRAS